MTMDAAWTAYLGAARDSMVASWNRARDAYLTLREVRESFGLTLVEQPGEATPDPGALSPGDDQEFVYMNGVVLLLSKWADEAIAGKRRGFFDGDALMIEQLPEDTLRMIPGPGGRPVLVDAQTGDAVPITGTIGNWAIVGALVAVAVAGVALYFTADRMASALEKTAEMKTNVTITEKAAEMVQSGKATPEQADKIVRGLYRGAESLKKADVEEKGEKTGWQQTITTVAWIGLGIAGLVFTAKILPMALGSGRCS